MSERTKLLKKALLTGVGATTSGERIKSALNEAFDDLAKIAQDLLSELEGQGKDKTKSANEFLKKLRKETEKRSKDLEKNVTAKVQDSVKKTAKEIGLVMRKDFDALSERVDDLEKALARKNRNPKA